MVMIGVDSHKRTHTVVALDDVGRRVGEKTVAATSEGHLLLVQWAAQWPEVTFALEDCRHLRAAWNVTCYWWDTASCECRPG